MASSNGLSLQEIADLVGGRLLDFSDCPPNATDSSGDAVQGKSLSAESLATVCTGAAPPAEAGPQEITLIDQANHVGQLSKSKAIAVIAPEYVAESPIRLQILVDDPHAAFTQLVGHFRPALDDAMTVSGIDPTAKVHPSSQVHPSANVGANVEIGPGCTIAAGVTIAAGCQIDADCTLHPNVTLYAYCQLGERVTLHAGTVVGAHGFGYKMIDGRHVPTAQLGYVVIENDVEVGASSTIDRGTYGATRIGEGTKIDNQVMIAHNCQIGRHNLLCSQVGIAGSCTTGDYVVLAGQVGLKDHIALADGVIVGAQAGVMDDLAPNQVYLGSPATPQRDQMQIMAVQRKLPEMRRDLKRLTQQVARMNAASEEQAADTNRRKAA
ncbi:UDP-3-O-(3-hydroxymyristoyl)glucosamine N-acyltransferase [Rhodopirellula bahusiensis]|uniref:UDP-3-O-acylglucosamine N-acyltransferase n=1 Tax=Rhodopirellula bahusiensis TaxID=2014065 RepID=A0A2G1W5K8_9BACT|nr:UDP-3-O-(3-hydroxymyristoyl)glucosamine N-acyltransferase [Rhodopirellula bahusiensis]PHQ34305.1 UDP-3-O-(3-hydroxymyristoyl)glucosamine N-acyltransferase [Rhodopirellula bahusiensis]